MAEDIRTQIGNFWKGLRKKATEAVESQEVGFVRGKVAARSVFDNAGNLIVDSGQTIDDGVIARAQEAGKLGALVSAAVTAQAQDVREKAKQIYESTPEGTEARSLATSEQYLEARRYIGWKAAMDVTDIRGTILVPAGKEIEDEDVRAVREAGQLGALIASAEQSGPPAAAPLAAPYMPYADVAKPAVSGEMPAPVPTTGRRTARPLTSYYDEETEETSEP
ncbi:MAG TPA: hypothetical protein VKU00_16340 [Chthonomonadaceae bacterium]|nr:hypothetical protein [Chthonomonadaceae bacterium]